MSGAAALVPALLPLSAAVTVVLLLAIVAAGVLRRAAPALRSWIWTVALAAVLALPALAATARWWPLPLPPIPVPRMVSLPFAGGSASAGAAAGAVAAAAATASPRPRLDAGTAAGTLYLAVAALLLARLAGGRWLLGRRAAAVPPLPAALAAEAAAAAASLRRCGRVRFLLGPAGSSPVTWGAVRPVVRLPADCPRWPASRRRHALLHELAHVERRDSLRRLLGELAGVAFWFHPLVWLVLALQRHEAEAACDDRVVGLGVRPSEYAADLVALAGSPRAAAGLAWLGGGRASLRRRVRSLAASRPRRSGRLAAAATVVAALAVTLPLAALAAGRGDGVAAALPAGDDAGGAPWSPHQLRWSFAGESGGYFVEGRADLAALAAARPFLGRDGFFLAARAVPGGGVVTTGGFADAAGRPRLFHDAGGGTAPELAGWAAPVLRRVAAGWGSRAEASLAPVAALAGASAAGRVSGSMLFGIPGWSDDPGTGVSQAGWEVDGRRHGAFARGVTVAGDGGRVGVSPGGWLVLYEWSAARRSLRRATLMPGGEVRYAVDGVAAPFDDAAARWLAATVRGYGATARRYRPSSHPAVAAPAAR